MSLNQKELCGNKVKYPTYDAGERGLKNLIRNKNEQNMHVYHCPKCQKFHVGHITIHALERYKQRRKLKIYKRVKGIKHV